MKITSKRHRYLIPLATAGLGMATFGTGIGFALSGNELALLPVGTSNLAMVLAIIGATVFIPSLLFLHWRLREDDVKINRQTIGTCLTGIVAIAVASIIGTAIMYGGLHLGLGPLLTSSLGLEASIGLQVGLSFTISAICASATLLSVYAFLGADKEYIYRERWYFVLNVVGCALLGAAATVAGPALTNAMGIADTSVEAIVLASLISISILAFAGTIKDGAQYLRDKGYLGVVA